MPDLKFAVLFSAVDRFSDKLGSMGEAMGRFTDRVTAGGEHIHEVGQRMVEWGERVGITSAILSEGANKMHEWSEAISEPAIGMQQSMATMAAVTGLAGDKLDEIKERAIAFSNTHPGVTAEEWVTGFTSMQGIFHNTAAAMKSEDTAGMLKRFGIDNDTATKLIQTSWTNLRTDSTTTGNQVLRAMHVFAIAPQYMNQFATASARLGASAAAAHAGSSEVYALVGEANKLMGPGRGAMIFDQMVKSLETAKDKGNVAIDFSHGVISGLQQLKDQITGPLILPEKFSQLGKKAQERFLEQVKAGQMERLAALGIGDPAQWANLLNHLDEVKAGNKAVANSAITMDGSYKTAINNVADQTALLHQNISSLYDAVYTPVLPTITGWLTSFTHVVQGATSATEHHSEIARVAALSLTAVGSGAYYGLQGLAAFGTMTSFAGEGIKALSKFADWQSIALRGMYAWDAVKGIGSSIMSFGSSLLAALPSLYAFDAAMLLNPITIGIAAALALAAAAYEIYEHWSAVAGFFENLWKRVKTTFTEVGTWMKDTGLAWMKFLGEGILAGTEWAFKAAWHVAEKIGGLFHSHSPPDYGPLREAVTHFHLGEALAANINPAPVVSAAEHTASGIAGAVAPARSAAGGSIVVHYAPVIHGGASPDEWVKAAKAHADELVRIIESKIGRRSRLEFA